MVCSARTSDFNSPLCFAAKHAALVVESEINNAIAPAREFGAAKTQRDFAQAGYRRCSNLIGTSARIKSISACALASNASIRGAELVAWQNFQVRLH